ncbi:MAG: cardiolipin synthetase [Bacillaceae bacterium]|nr:cardiolipin synthetase [Bacillaceae bacterium]
MIWIVSGIAFIIIAIIITVQIKNRPDTGESDHLKFSATSGSFTFYYEGYPMFQDLFQDIYDAKKEVNIQFFIVKRDMISQQFFALLKECAQKGVTVRLLLDRLGCFRITKTTRQELEKAGVQVAFSEKPTFPHLLYQMNRRNHRKIAIIDGKTGYVGGYNLGKEYTGRDPQYNAWRDYHLRMTGKVVNDLQKIFEYDWKEAKEPISPIYETLPEDTRNVQVLATNGKRLEEHFLALINGAQGEILIGTPYFIPSQRLFNAMIRALKRGVMIKILLPMSANHPFVKEAGIPYFTELKEAGADVRLFDQGFYHSKMILIDQNICDLGTANFDMRSLFLNKEINLLITDRGFIQNVRDHFMSDFKTSIPVSKQWMNQLDLGTKLRIPIARLLRPLL